MLKRRTPHKQLESMIIAFSRANWEQVDVEILKDENANDKFILIGLFLLGAMDYVRQTWKLSDPRILGSSSRRLRKRVWVWK